MKPFRENAASAACLAPTGVILGAWFKHRQLALFCAGLDAVYPSSYRLYCIVAVLLALSACWLAWGAAVDAVFAPRDPRRWQAAHAATYWTLVPCALGAPLTICLRAFLGVNALLPFLLRRLDGPGRRRTGWPRHAAALALVAVVQAASNRIVSPLSWSEPMSAFAKDESIQLGENTPLYPENFAGAKNLDLTSFSYAYWGSAPHPPCGGFSYGAALLTWLMDPALIDVRAIFRVVQALLFLWCVAGSFGFYLFLAEGLSLSPAAALVGGALFVPANPFLCMLIKYFSPLFAGPLLTLPFALLLYRLAVRADSAALAFVSGLAFDLGLYALPSHPEPVAHALALLLAYAVFSSLWAAAAGGRLRPLRLLPALGAGLAAAGSLAVLPAWDALRRGELSVFGHFDQALRFAIHKPAFLFPLDAPSTLAPLAALAAAAPRFLRDRDRREPFVFFACVLLAILLGLACLAVRAPDQAAFHDALMFLMVRAIRLKACLLFAALALAALGLDVAFRRLSRRKPFLVPVAAAALIAAGAAFGAGSLRGAEGPDPCVPLQTLLAGARGLTAPDPASLRLLRTRLGAAADRLSDEDLPAIADGAARLADRGCAASAAAHPYYAEGPPPPDRAYAYRPDFNLAPLLAAAGGRFGRVFAAAGRPADFIGAVSPGYRLNGPSTIVDTRFMSVAPALQALYLLPGQMDSRAGGYGAPVPWGLGPDVVLRPGPRRLLEIAGAAGFLVDRADLGRVRKVPGLEPAPSSLPEPFARGLVPVIDRRSFGEAYLARRVGYAAPESDVPGPPFDPARPQAEGAWRRWVESLRSRLLELSGTGSVIVEDAARAGTSSAAGGGGEVSIANIAGGKAAFRVRCAADPCVLVFNEADAAGWKAFSDARPLSIRRANFAFLSVEVPAGEHLVWFERRLGAELAAALATLAAYALGLAALLARRAYRRGAASSRPAISP